MSTPNTVGRRIASQEHGFIVVAGSDDQPPFTDTSTPRSNIAASLPKAALSPHPGPRALRAYGRPRAAVETAAGSDSGLIGVASGAHLGRSHRGRAVGVPAFACWWGRATRQERGEHESSPLAAVAMR